MAGRIEGVVAAKERLLLQKTGSIEGDISTPLLEVEEGGRLNGRSTMPPRPQTGYQPMSRAEEAS